MLTHQRSLFRARFTAMLILICVVLLDISAYGQKQSSPEKGVPEIRRGVTTVLGAKSPPDLETTLLRDPCKGEQPGNVLGISEQAPMPQRVTGFIKKLREPDPRTRACAARQLGYLGPDAQDALPHLIQLFYNEKNWPVRSNVEDGLWAIGPGRSSENLNESMSRRAELLEMIKAPDAYVRFYATFALGYHKPLSDEKRIVQALIAATNDQDRLVQWMAIIGLGRLGSLSAAAVPVLIKFLQTDDQPMRVQSTIALGRIGPDAAEAVPALLGQLYGSDYSLYLFSATALARIGPVILPMLGREIKTHPLQVLQVLDDMGSDGVPLLMEALRMPNKEVRKKAMEIVQWLGDAAAPALPLLVKALADKDSETRRTAAGALSSLGPVARDAIPALIARLKDDELLVRCEAAESLGAIGPAAKAAIPKLVQMMNAPAEIDSDMSQRCAAKGLMKMSAEAKALVPASMIKRVKERDAELRDIVTPLFSSIEDPTKPKARQKDKPPPRVY